MVRLIPGYVRGGGRRLSIFPGPPVPVLGLRPCRVSAAVSAVILCPLSMQMRRHIRGTFGCLSVRPDPWMVS